jgi:hypothetical protein
MKCGRRALIAFLFLMAVPSPGPLYAAPAGTGQVHISFLYNAPTETLEPSYHTAIWLADKNGRLLKTLYVSDELSHMVYKFGYACPDWVKQSGWEKAAKSDVDAVTAPTPELGETKMQFDLDKLGIKPGTYQIWFQINLSEKFNVLFRGTFVAGGDKPQKINHETLFQPSKVEGAETIVTGVTMEFLPAGAK